MNTIKIKNIAELKTRKGTPESIVEVLGYYTPGDGGGGDFYWDNTSTEIDDLGTVIQVSGVTTGRWKRIYSTNISVKWFGAKGDGINNDTLAFQQAINIGGFAYVVGEGVEIFIPNGVYIISSTIYIRNGTTIIGEGIHPVKLQYTGNGTLFNANNTSNHTLKGFKAFTNVNSTTFIETFGNNNTLKDIEISSEGSLTGWANGIVINSTVLNGFNFKQIIEDVYFNKVKLFGLKANHAIDIQMNRMVSYAEINSTLFTFIEFDTGVSGVTSNNSSAQYGKNALVVKHTLGGIGSGAYALSPNYLFFNSFVADTQTGGDGIIFDSTLGSNILSADFVNCWCSFCGMNKQGVAITPTACGIRINGGFNINFQGRIRVNALHGVYINSINAQHIKIHDSMISENNMSATINGSGIYVNTSSESILIDSNNIGSLGDGNTQKYAIYIATITTSNLIISNNILEGNLISPINNNALSSITLIGNSPNLVNYLPKGIVIAPNNLNTGIQGSALTVNTNSNVNLPKINSGLIVLRDIINGGSVVYLIDEVVGAVKIAGDAKYVVGIGTTNQIGLDANTSNTKLYNNTTASITFGYNILGVQMTMN
jgi:hypothetical protein